MRARSGSTNSTPTSVFEFWNSGSVAIPAPARAELARVPRHHPDRAPPPRAPPRENSVTGSHRNPGLGQIRRSSRQRSPCKPVSSASSRCAAASPSSPSSTIPAGSSRSSRPAPFAELASEHEPTLPVEGHDRDRPWMLDELTLARAPALDDDLEELPTPDDLALFGFHDASAFACTRATSPAAYAARKKSGSSRRPRPMWLSGSPAHASSQPSGTSSGDPASSGTQTRSRTA